MPFKPSRTATRMLAPLSRVVARLFGAYGEVAVLKLLRKQILSPGPMEIVKMRSKGIHWELDTRDQLQRVFLFTGSWELSALNLILRRLQPGDIVLDIGAHIGLFTIPIASRLDPRKGGRVIAVEPGRETFEQLKANVEANFLAGHVHLIQAALGQSDGVGTLSKSLRWPEDRGTLSLFGGGSPVETVKIVTGAEILTMLGISKVDVLKLDVEGAELDVLQGLSDWFNDSWPRLAVVEIDAEHQARSGRTPKDVLSFMKSRGYEAWKIRTRGPRKLDLNHPKSQGNWLFKQK